MNRVKQLRQEHKWRQADLAKQLNTSQQAIGHYETGERGLDVETIEKLCTIFDCTSDYLLGFSNQRRFEITDEEATLLAAYRNLSTAGKEYVMHSLALAGMAHSEKNRTVSDLETAN